MTDSFSATTVVRAFYESYNDKDLPASFDAYIAPDLTNHVMDGAFDRAGWLAADSGLFPAFADFSLSVLDQLTEGDKVATRYQLGGTQTGEFFGIPASGRIAFLHATSVDRVAHGRIVEHWGDLDFSGFLQQLSGPASDSNDALHELADRYVDLVNAHDLDGLVALHTPDYVSHDPGGDTDLDSYRAQVGGFFAAFADSRIAAVNVVAQGDRLVIQVETTGTQTADFIGIPATGATVRFTELRVRRIADGRIAEHWGLIDQPTLLEQLRRQ